MNKYIPTKKEFYIAIAAATVGIGALIFSIVLVYINIRSISRDLSAAEAETVGIEETFSIKKNLSDWENEITILDSFFVNQGQEVVFIENLEKAAQEAGVKIEIDSIAVGKKTSGFDFVENLNVKIIFEGEWTHVSRFMTALEKMPYAISIESVDANLLNKIWGGTIDITVLKIKDA